LASVVMSDFVLTALRQPANAARGQASKPAPVANAPRDPSSEQLYRKLLDLMEKQQTFREPRLNLHQLAEMTGVPARTLSELVNREFGQNVTDFINRYRIEEAKRLLLDPRYDTATLLALAEDVGFGSKSSFNLTFKKHTSMTPSEFRASSVS
jgi:AraC-like DNA-binding protein